MQPILKFFKKYKPYNMGAIWCAIVFVLSLLLNTSFHIMGVDVAEFISLILGDFIVVILISYSKILIIFLAFSCILSYFISEFTESLKIKKRFAWILFISLQINLLFHSIITYPQLYGEFFYIRYPSLIGILHFLTDWVSPYILLGLTWLFAIVLLCHFLFSAFENRSKQFAFLTFALLSFIGFHFYNSPLGLISVMILIPFASNYWNRLQFKTTAYLLLIPIFAFSFPIIWEIFYFKTNQFFINQDPKSPNIFILSSDSLRYDRLGFISGDRQITPNIDKFSRDSIVYHDHHVTIPRTFPSWADLLTGEYSMSHGIRDMFPAPSEKRNIGTPRFPTIPQILKKKGYRSIVLGNFAADIFPRANFGFDEIFCPDFNAKILTTQRGLDSQIFLLPILTGSYLFGGEYLSEVAGLSNLGDGSRLLRNFKSLIRKNSTSPLFFVNFSSVVHFPYTPPYPFYKKFTNSEYYGKYKYFKFVDPSADSKPDQIEIQQIRGVFDSAIHAYDDEFGSMIHFLQENGLYDESIIILTADHGEALYEDIHGQGHGEHLRGEVVTKVPLLIKYPKSYNKNNLEAHVDSKDYKGITSSIDLYPTILEYLNIPMTSAKPGKSLIASTEDSVLQKDRSVYSETGIWFSDRGNQFFQKQRIPYPNIMMMHKVVVEEDYQIMITDRNYRETIAFSKHRSIQNSRYKLIYIPTREGVIFELYDRIQDPMNTNNLWPLGNVGPKLKKELLELVNQASKVKIVGEYILPQQLP
ncbi:sulfatase-like hydrolase/transferase [Leptospira sp. GIMC2001]|uniref:sulfatase-like hydrolase/transferase n=1 Tax=Leptospira sp. GIMC2001 TaxID=1513297 RepID=UPI00234BC9E9|nr:sulfatase-like hydrolase/transferase [Leptospira sp. GIMC2001]WCL48335.1 sulfatase-like hydrolase/transferase [Leptospira sp. GIMC2001]